MAFGQYTCSWFSKLQMTDDIIKLMSERINQNYRPKVNNQNNRRDNRNNKRKY